MDDDNYREKLRKVFMQNHFYGSDGLEERNLQTGGDILFLIRMYLLNRSRNVSITDHSMR